MDFTRNTESSAGIGVSKSEISLRLRYCVRYLFHEEAEFIKTAIFADDLVACNFVVF